MTVKLENKRNDLLRIKVSIWVPSRREYIKATAIFDTGAYKSILDERLADLLQITRNISTSTTVTASGAVTTQSGILPKMHLGTKLITDIPVNVMKLPDEIESYCILGMNVLREFDISISSYDGVVMLIQKPLPFKYRVKDYSVTLSSTENVNIGLINEMIRDDAAKAEKQEIAGRLFKRGLNVSVVAEDTELDESKVLELKAKLDAA